MSGKPSKRHDLERDPRPWQGDWPVVVGRDAKKPKHSAPNLTLNVHGQVGRGGIYAAAAFGTALQLGILAYFALATKYLPLRSYLRKDDQLVADYAFPCAAAGTILIVVGILTCAYVVEKSTLET